MHLNIYQGNHRHSAFKKHYKTNIWTLTSLRYKGTFHQKVYFIWKDSCAHCLCNGTLETFVASTATVLQQLQYRVIFDGYFNFLLFMSAQVFVSANNPPKKTLHGICHSTTPIRTTKVPKVPWAQLSFLIQCIFS